LNHCSLLPKSRDFIRHEEEEKIDGCVSQQKLTERKGKGEERRNHEAVRGPRVRLYISTAAIKGRQNCHFREEKLKGEKKKKRGRGFLCILFSSEIPSL